MVPPAHSSRWCTAAAGCRCQRRQWVTDPGRWVSVDALPILRAVSRNAGWAEQAKPISPPNFIEALLATKPFECDDVVFLACFAPTRIIEGLTHHCHSPSAISVLTDQRQYDAWKVVSTRANLLGCFFAAYNQQPQRWRCLDA